MSARLCDHALEVQQTFCVGWTTSWCLATHPRASTGHCATLEQVCGQLHFALKHDEGEASQSMKALGLQFDLALQEVTPSDAAKRAIQDALRVAIADPTGLNFLRWFGHVSWLNHAVGRLPMATHRAIMDTARSVTCRDLRLGTDTNVWAADAENLTTALCSSRRRRTVAPEAQGPAYIMD